MAARTGLNPSRATVVSVLCLVGLLGLLGVLRVAPVLLGATDGVVFLSDSEQESKRAHAGEYAPSTGEAVGTEDFSRSASATVFVHVVGAVRRPGLYEIALGSRVKQALDAAGGALSSAAPQGVNLAREVVDGEQLMVPTLEEWEADGHSVAYGSGTSPGAHHTTAPAALIDINTADAVALQSLPGIGPATAEKIVADRVANGPFSSPNDLMRVSGIGPAKLEALKDLVTAK